MTNRRQPNQSLKLTEIAVDDFARAKLGVTIGRDLPRADWLPSQRSIRRRLAPVRYASLAAGKVLRNKSEIKDQLFKPVSSSRGVVFSRIGKPVPAASEFIGEQIQINNRNQINHRAHMLNMQWHNHSLNLTEPAVDDLTRAKQTGTIGRSLPRAD